MENGNFGRTRMNVSITAKGAAQWDVTAEYATPNESQEKLAEAIKGVRRTIAEAGLKEANSQEAGK